MSEDRSLNDLAFLKEEVKRLRQALKEMTPGVDVLLRRRGFQIYRKEPADDLLLPSDEFLDDYYRIFRKYSFRLFLRDAIKHQESFTARKVARYASPQVTRGYIAYLAGIGLAEKYRRGYRLVRRMKSFGQTLEWYFAELLKREFGADAVWGAKFKRPDVGGDYDVVAKIDGSILYAEVKSSPPKQIYDSEISAFLDRVSDLRPEISIFFMDTELRMKDKIVPMFEEALRERHRTPPVVLRIEKELFRIRDEIFIINAGDSIIRNIETVLKCYFDGGGNRKKAVRNAGRKPV
ncbi:MAG: hypothetical protein M0Z60_08375 [Nitrospiraceae bacterium]|nr:hypothetical protein [Nitrospiraceae bacterium]